MGNTCSSKYSACLLLAILYINLKLIAIVMRVWQRLNTLQADTMKSEKDRNSYSALVCEHVQLLFLSDYLPLLFTLVRLRVHIQPYRWNRRFSTTQGV